MFVVHLVGEADGANIAVVRPGPPFEPLVDDDVMYEEIGETIGHDTEAYGLQGIMLIEGSEEDGQEAGDGEDEEERVVLFEEAMRGPVVVGVEKPAEPMHDIFMGQPGDAFHGCEREDQDAYIC